MILENKEKLLKDIESLKCLIDADFKGEEPVCLSPELVPVYESAVLMQRRYENRLREMKQAASERDAFYGEMQQIRAEHHMAEEIQRSLLPGKPEKYLGAYGVDLFADMDTAWGGGGAYYDFFPVDEDRLFFCVGDVAGKGVSAAIFCSVVKTLISMSLQNGEELHKVCADVTRRMFQSQNSRSKMFVTLGAGSIDRRDGRVELVNAGHDIPFLIRKGRDPETLDIRSGMPIGSYYNARKPEMCAYTKGMIGLEKGDILLLYTDGLTDSEDSGHDRYGSQRLADKIREISSADMTSKEVVAFLERGIDSFADRGERDDDITLLALRYLGYPYSA